MLKKNIYEIFEHSTEKNLFGKVFDIFLISLIILNVIAVILGTERFINENFKQLLDYFEILSVLIFTIEYFLRIWTCTYNERYRGIIKGRIKYALSPLSIIDLLAILPFYLPLILPFDLRFIRALRLFRLCRLFKLGRYTIALKLITQVVKNKKEELIVAIFIVAMMLVMAASFMYYAENQVQPEKFSGILEAMWWGIATLTTVGYGDVYPITVIGKIFGGIIALLGIGLFALPAGIISSGLLEIMQKEKKCICPKCGTEIK